MRIKIIEKGEKDHNLAFPTWLLLNGISASVFAVLINIKLRKYRVRIKGSSCRKFVRAFYKTRRHFGGKLDLVDVESKDGNLVKISF